MSRSFKADEENRIVTEHFNDKYFTAVIDTTTRVPDSSSINYNCKAGPGNPFWKGKVKYN